MWYATIDRSHKILGSATCVDVSEALTIAKLKKLIWDVDPDCRDVDLTRLNIYRPNMTVEQAEEIGAGETIGGEWNKLAPSKKIANLNIGEEEILLIELPCTLFFFTLLLDPFCQGCLYGTALSIKRKTSREML
jgi:hypothetical protein